MDAPQRPELSGQHFASVSQSNDRAALEATEAGRYLAQLLALPRPISATAMWKYARLGEIPHKRLGRHVWFMTDELEEFARRDGSNQKSA